MRKLTIAVLLAASTFASFAQAAPQATADAVPFAVDVQGKPVARTWMGVDQFKPYAGVYAMANGKVLRISNQQNRFYAQFDNEPAVRIYAVSGKDFVAHDGDLTLKFDHEDGHHHDDVIAFVPSTGVSVASR